MCGRRGAGRHAASGRRRRIPLNILVLIAGVTYVFGIAQGNGTMERVVQKLLAAVGARRGLLPFIFFLITAGVAAMGSPQAGYVVMPLAMPAAPTSLFGIVTNGTAPRPASILIRWCCSPRGWSRI